MASSYKHINKLSMMHSPVYIHSHPTALNNKSILISTKQKMEKSKDLILQSLESITSYLKQLSSDTRVVNFYQDTHDSQGNRIVSKEAQKLIDLLLLYRKKLETIKKHQEKNKTADQISKDLEEY